MCEYPWWARLWVSASLWPLDERIGLLQAVRSSQATLSLAGTAERLLSCSCPTEKEIRLSCN